MESCASSGSARHAGSKPSASALGGVEARLDDEHMPHAWSCRLVDSHCDALPKQSSRALRKSGVPALRRTYSSAYESNTFALVTAAMIGLAHSLPGTFLQTHLQRGHRYEL